MARQLEAVRDDLKLTGLNFRMLRRKQFRKCAFFCAVAVMQVCRGSPLVVAEARPPSLVLVEAPCRAVAR